MEEIKKKQYIMELLYDNGVEESYPTGEMTEEELNELLIVPYRVFCDGVNGVLQFRGYNGETVLIQCQKITRLIAKEVSEII